MSYILLKDCIGKDRGWKVNMITVEIWSKQILDEAFSATSNYAAVYGGLIANCKVKQVEPDFTFEQVCDWVDSLPTDSEIIKEIKDKFEESQYYIALVKKLQGIVDDIESDNLDKKKEQTNP